MINNTTHNTTRHALGRIRTTQDGARAVRIEATPQPVPSMMNDKNFIKLLSDNSPRAIEVTALTEAYKNKLIEDDNKIATENLRRASQQVPPLPFLIESKLKVMSHKLNKEIKGNTENPRKKQRLHDAQMIILALIED